MQNAVLQVVCFLLKIWYFKISKLCQCLDFWGERFLWHGGGNFSYQACIRQWIWQWLQTKCKAWRRLRHTHLKMTIHTHKDTIQNLQNSSRVDMQITHILAASVTISVIDKCFIWKKKQILEFLKQFDIKTFKCNCKQIPQHYTL